MATATRKPQAARKPSVVRKPAAARKPQPAGKPRTAARSAPFEFRLFENNAGEHHWVLSAKNGTILAQSRPFASLAAAQAGAVAVRDGASAARLEHRPSASPLRVRS